MGVITISQEFTCPITPSRMFKALILESNTLVPKLLPQFIKSIETVQGNGGAGSIEQVTFTEGSHYNQVKHRIDLVDAENFLCKYALIEGDVLGEKLDHIDYEIKFEEIDGGGCSCRMKSEYVTVGDFEVKEEEIREGKNSAMGIYRAVEAYLLENPNVYA